MKKHWGFLALWIGFGLTVSQAASVDCNVPAYVENCGGFTSCFEQSSTTSWTNCGGTETQFLCRDHVGLCEATCNPSESTTPATFIEYMIDPNGVCAPTPSPSPTPTATPANASGRVCGYVNCNAITCASGGAKLFFRTADDLNSFKTGVIGLSIRQSPNFQNQAYATPSENTCVWVTSYNQHVVLNVACTVGSVSKPYLQRFGNSGDCGTAMPNGYTTPATAISEDNNATSWCPWKGCGTDNAGRIDYFTNTGLCTTPGTLCSGSPSPSASASPSATPNCSVNCSSFGNQGTCNANYSQGCWANMAASSGWTDPDGTNRCECQKVKGDYLFSCNPTNPDGTCEETECRMKSNGLCSVMSTSPTPAPTAAPTAAPTVAPTPDNSGTTTGASTTTTGTTTGSTDVDCDHAKGATRLGTEPPTVCSCIVGGAQFDGATGACSCPTDYEIVVTQPATNKAECRPKLTAEFYRDDSSNYFPVCGVGRIPIDSANRTSINSASNGKPRSTATVASSGLPPYNYLYATGSSSAPIYLYKNLNHCACAATISDSAGTTNDNPAGSGLGSVDRFPADNWDVITANAAAQVSTHGPVTIARSSTVDGRSGNLFKSGFSQCECPNFNEAMVSVGADGNNPTGMICKPTVSVPHRVLVDFDPGIHDISGRSQVMDRSSAMKVSTTSNALVKAVVLGRASTGTAQYTRKIWTCADPYTLNSSGDCVFEDTRNACNEGNGSDVPASVVSANISGATKPDKFLNTKNKKLACCLNQFTPGGSDPQKFDCVQTESKTYQNFDTLWSSADTAAQGGQLNALMLTNASGRDVSGFYSLTGSRCEEFSEFAGNIQPGIVNPAMGVGAQMKRANNKAGANEFESKGPAIPLPGSGSGGGSAAYSYVLGKMVGLGKTVPSSAADRRRCPILVRAAMVATCPSPSTPQAINSGGSVRCGIAVTVDVHVRVEQVWEIAGQPKMATTDSIVNGINAAGEKTMAGSISIDRIIANKYGNQCPPGQTHVGPDNACGY